MKRTREKIKEKVMAALELPSAPVEELAAVLREVKLHRLYADPDIAGLLRERDEVRDVRELLDDADILVALDRSFTDRIAAIGARFDSRSDELYHTMLVHEQQLRSTCGLPTYEHFNTSIVVEFLDEGHYKNPLDFGASVDYAMSYFSLTLRSFLEAGERMAVHYDSAKFDAACLHLPLSGEWAIFHERRSIWEHGQARGTRHENVAVFDASGSELLSAFRVSLSRLRGVRQGESFNPMTHPAVAGSTRKLPIDGFRSNDEVKSAYMTTQQFYSEDLREEVRGARLCEWIRAYTVVKEIAKKHIESHPLIGQPATLLLHKTADFFLAEFVAAGIPVKSAEQILRRFTFNASSKDILDAPLIPFNGELVLVPTAALLIEPAFSLESLLKSIRSRKDEPNHELQFIGPGFEKLTRRVLADAGIVARKVKHKNRDCDVAFVLEDDVLFLCECKGRFQTSDFRSYVELEAELGRDAAQQHRKTCDYFESHLAHVRDRLGLAPTWVPSRVMRVILTSAKLGRVRFNEDFYVIDENMFYAFFARKKLSMRPLSSRRRTFVHDPRLDGPITVDAFIAYMDDPPSISRTRMLLEERELHFELEGRMITFKDVECYGELLKEHKESAVWTFPGTTVHHYS